MSTVWLDDGMGRRLSRVGLETAFYRLLVFIRPVTSCVSRMSRRSPVFGLPIVYLHAFVYSKGSSAELHRTPTGLRMVSNVSLGDRGSLHLGLAGLGFGPIKC